MLKLNRTAIVLLASLAASFAARAAEFDFSGNIVYKNDVVRIGFTLASDATDVKVWTDSFDNAANFDPSTAVWSRLSGTLVAQNDDKFDIAPGQTYFDSGIIFPALAQGDYTLTIVVFPNARNSANLAAGFALDGAAPDPITTGTFWRVHLSGVDTVTPVPEPATYAMFGLGLAALAWARRRRA